MPVVGKALNHSICLAFMDADAVIVHVLDVISFSAS